MTRACELILSVGTLTDEPQTSGRPARSKLAQTGVGNVVITVPYDASTDTVALRQTLDVEYLRAVEALMHGIKKELRQ